MSAVLAVVLMVLKIIGMILLALLLLLLLALLLVNGTLPEKCAFPVTAVLCVLATACGGVWAARGTSLGPLPAALLAWLAGALAAAYFCKIF